MTGNEGHETADTRHRDTAIDRAWREASDEQPPPRVDAAILAAAREALSDTDARVTAIAARRRPGGRWTRWQPLLAAASVAGLAFVLLQTLPRDRDAAPPPGVASQSRPVTADEATELSPAAMVVPDAPPASAPASPAALAERSASAALPATAVSAAPPAPLQAGVGRDAAPPGVVGPAAAIAALHASGDLAAAAAALRAFRAEDPRADDRLPESLHDWARTVE
jgi:hypothetical protein